MQVRQQEEATFQWALIAQLEGSITQIHATDNDNEAIVALGSSAVSSLEGRHMGGTV